MRSLVDLLVARAASHPARGFRFVDDDTVLSYRELDRDARRIASVLAERNIAPGARVALAYPAGLDFVRAFWGCIYAGVIAVPVPAPHPARLARTLPRLRAIVTDCTPSAVLTTAALATRVPELGDVITTDDATGDPMRQPHDSPSDAIALLQYTSGSTRSPRGVVLDHANILHNLGLLRAFHLDQHDMVMAHWLPLYHDMGLIRGMLSPVHMGADCVMLSAEKFVERPARWLAAVTSHKATTIGAPNFGFELCTRKISDAELATLDLSSLRLVFSSAEPVRKGTIDRFLARFGLDPTVFRPAYGLAEATVAVAGELSHYTTHAVSASALRDGRIESATSDDRYDLVSCGAPLGDMEVAIIDGNQRAAPDRVGEIWVRGGSVARGYWGQTDPIFGAELGGTGPFLRTGDLGWCDADGGLAIVGRMKDAIIIRGQTFYPQDLEAAVESVPLVRAGCTAAFAIETPDGEAAVIVAEIDVVDWPASVAAIRAAISEQLGLALAAIVAVERGTLPKTASGKVQRALTRTQYERGELSALQTWTHPPRDQ
ncbi:MAG TPA: fatty acyl-AMP ligase [Kofleriaceae bacterium]